MGSDETMIHPANAVRPQFMLVSSLQCPAECSYCFGSREGPCMPPGTMEAALDFIAGIASETAHQKVKVTFHGGEPLTAGHEIWRRALEGLDERFGRGRCEVGVQSNLWLLDDEFCELFLRHGVEIGTSLDGPEEITDTQRGDGYFARTMQGIEMARQSGLRVGCIATFTPARASRWREVAQFFLAERLSFSIQPSVPRMDNNDALCLLNPKRLAELLLSMLEFYVEHRREMVIPSLDEMCKAVACGESEVCTFRDCLGMFLAIDPSGDIYPCQRFCGLPAYRLGALSDQPTLSQLLNSLIAQRIAERQARVREQCAECIHVEYCLGGCAYNAWSSREIARVKDPYCQGYRTIFDNIKGRLVSEMKSKENINAIASHPFPAGPHPLLMKGPLSEILERGTRSRRGT